MEKPVINIYQLFEDVDKNSETAMNKFEGYINLFNSFNDEFRKSSNNRNDINTLNELINHIDLNNKYSFECIKSIYIHSSRSNKVLKHVDNIGFKHDIESLNIFNELKSIMTSIIDFNTSIDKLIMETKGLSVKLNLENLLRVSSGNNEATEPALETALRSILTTTLDCTNMAGVTDKLSEIYAQIQKIIRDHKIDLSIYESFSIYYIKKLNEEKNNIINSFQKEMERIQDEYKIISKDFDTNMERFSKSTNLLSSSVDAGLRNLNDLNEKTQTLEIQFKKIIENKTSEIDTEFEATKLEMTNKISRITNELATEEQQIKVAHKDLLKLLEKTSIHKLTENYKTKALAEEKDYKTNSRITIGSIIFAIVTTVAIIGMPIYEYWKHVPPIEPNYFTMLARLTISLMFFVLAVYTSKQAAKHYECYQENYRTYLQLAALEPFMSRMSEEEQKSIRKSLIPVYFNQNTDGKFAPKGEEVALPSDIKAYAEKLIDVGKSLLDKSSDQTKPNGN